MNRPRFSCSNQSPETLLALLKFFRKKEAVTASALGRRYEEAASRQCGGTGWIVCALNQSECPKEFGASGHAPARPDRSHSFRGRKGTYRSLWVRWQPVIYFCAWKQYCRGHRHQCENRSPHDHGNSEPTGCGLFPRSQQTLCREQQGKAVHLRRNFL